MTEDEAKTKWCPQALTGMFMSGDTGGAPISVVHGCNRIVSDVPEIGAAIMSIIEITGATRCMGSKCMAWRWDNYHLQFEPSPTSPGHCGLAGKP